MGSESCLRVVSHGNRLRKARITYCTFEDVIVLDFLEFVRCELWQIYPWSASSVLLCAEFDIPDCHGQARGELVFVC